MAEQTQSVNEIKMALNVGGSNSVYADRIDMIGGQTIINYNRQTTSAKQLPKHWKNPDTFVGRINELQELKDLFEIRKRCCVLISGIGGQGKSFLAKKFIQEMTETDGSNGPVVTYINGETMQKLVNDIFDCAKNIGLPNNHPDTSNQSSATNIVIDSLASFSHRQTNCGWIVLIDNVDKKCMEFEEIVDKFVQCGSFLIITSRDVDIIEKEAENIHLQGLEPDAAASLVKELLLHEDEKHIFELCKELKSYPLGIRQAIAYIKCQQKKYKFKKNKYSVKNFLDDLRKEGTKIVSENKLRDYTGGSMFNIMEMTLEEIKSYEDGADSIKVFKVLSLVNADGVTKDYLGRLVESCYEITDLETPLSLLESVCFVEITTSGEETISVHRVVQTIVREKMKAENEIEKLLDKLLASHEYSLVKSHISSLDRNQLLHLIKIWEHSFEYSKLVQEHNDMATDIFNRLLVLTLYQELQEFSKGISKALRRFYGDLDRRTLLMEFWAGLGLETSGKFKEALEQYRVVWKNQIKHVGQFDVQTLQTQEQIASTLCRMKQWDESFEKHQEVYALMLKHIEKDHSYTRITQHNIAICLKEKGDLDEALPIFQDVYDFRKRSYGAKYSWTLDTRIHIADIWFQKMDFNKAMEEYEQVYDISSGEVGQLHENTLKAMEMCARCIWKLDRKKEGYEKLAELANINEKAWGSTHPTTIKIQALLREWKGLLN